MPKSVGGTDDEENLCLSCPRCNDFKGVQTQAVDPETQQIVSLFNPRRQNWNEHFVWSEDGAYILGQTACGRATVIALQLNLETAVAFRQWLVSVGWRPPSD